MEGSEASSGPTVAAEVEMAKSMKAKDFTRALEIFTAAAAKNVRATMGCLPALCTVLGQCAPCRERSAHLPANR